MNKHESWNKIIAIGFRKMAPKSHLSAICVCVCAIYKLYFMHGLVLLLCYLFVRQPKVECQSNLRKVWLKIEDYYTFIQINYFTRNTKTLRMRARTTSSWIWTFLWTRLGESAGQPRSLKEYILCMVTNWAMFHFYFLTFL